MNESYCRQSLPKRKSRELVGTAICVINQNNSLIIEIYMKANNIKQNEWYHFMKCTSGELKKEVKWFFEKDEEGKEIIQEFEKLVDMRNRIVHCFQYTGNEEQKLRTVTRDKKQYDIDDDYLLNFIKLNNELNEKLSNYRKALINQM